jgi:hypothetical protein
LRNENWGKTGIDPRSDTKDTKDGGIDGGGWVGSLQWDSRKGAKAQRKERGKYEGVKDTREEIWEEGGSGSGRVVCGGMRELGMGLMRA